MKRWVFVLGILWTFVWVAFIVYTGGGGGRILLYTDAYTDAQGVVHESPCAHDPTCGEIAAQWWAPLALWLVGLSSHHGRRVVAEEPTRSRSTARLSQPRLRAPLDPSIPPRAASQSGPTAYLFPY